MTKFAETQEAIQHLSPEERSELRHWILEEETPEMLAAIDVGVRSAETEPKLSAEDLRRKLHGWSAKVGLQEFTAGNLITLGLATDF